MDIQKLYNLPVQGEEAPAGEQLERLRSMFAAAFFGDDNPPKECPSGHKYRGPCCPTCGWREPQWGSIAWPTNGPDED